MKPTTQLLRALLIVGVLPLAASAQRDGDRIDTTLVLARGGLVQLGAVSGDIRVTGAERADVRLRADIERGRFDRSFSGSRIAVSTRSVGGRQGTARYDVTVPIGTRVSVSTVSGTVVVRATAGEVNVRTTSGSAEVRDARERLDVATVSGRIDVRASTGRIRIDGVSADVQVDEAGGELSAETVSGSISVRRSQLDALRASTVSGRVSYEGGLNPRGSYRLNSHSGSITLAIPGDAGANLELETFSGRISSDFPLTMQPGETGGRRGQRMEFTIGNGGARVVAGSFSGSVTIRRTTATNRE